MGMTARELGSLFGRTAAAMNLLLRDHGFLEGEPGAWRPTELGQQFAQSHDFDNGYGGYAYRSWGWLSWTDGLVDALKASLEAHPNGVAVASAPVPAAAAVASGPAPGPGGPVLTRGQWATVAALGVLAAAAPAASRAWNQQVKPAVSHVRAHLAARRASGDGTTDDDAGE